jgi:HemY protein
MKRLFVFMLLALIASVGFVILVKHDPGYVLISYGMYTLETSLSVAIVSFIVLWFILNRLFVYSSRIIRQSVALNRWFSTRHYRRSQKKTAQGIIAFVEGKWEQSRRLLTNAAAKSETPLINYLFAAWASNELRDDAKTGDLLRMAGESTAGAEVALEIAQAKMQIDRGYLENSLATLTRAKTNASQYPYVYKLLQQVYVGLNDWGSLTELLPELKKHNVIDKEELDALTQHCCKEQLKVIVHSEKGEEARVALLDIWRKQSKSVIRNGDVVLCYAQCLSKAGDEEGAEKSLRDQLNREWSQPLIDLYGIVKAGDTNKQLLHAENWLKQHNNDEQLFLCLGRLALRNQLWGKAREYFETSNKLAASSETCAELGRLLGRLGKHEQSNEYFHQGLLMSTQDLPELPMPNKH